MKSAIRVALAPRTRHVRISAALELAFVLALIMLYVWCKDQSLEKAVFGILVVATIITGWVVRRETLGDIGLLNKLVGIPMSVALAIKIFFLDRILTALAAHGTDPSLCLLASLSGWLIWTTWQEVAINGFFVRRFRDCGFTKTQTCLSVGVLFTLLHIPNPALMPAALVGATLSSAVFLLPLKNPWHRFIIRNMCFFGTIHFLADYFIKTKLPVALHHGLTVGWAYRHFAG